MQTRNFSAGHSSNSLNSKLHVDNLRKSPKSRKDFSDVIDEYKKSCLKSFIQPNNHIISVLKSETLTLSPEYSLKEILIINKIIGRHLNFKGILLETDESLKDYKEDKDIHSSQNVSSNISGNNYKKAINAKENKILTQKIRQKLEDKQTRKLAVERHEKIYSLMQGIAKNISLSNEIEVIKLYNVRSTPEFAEFLYEAFKSNDSVRQLYINFSDLTSESSDIILRGLLEHSKIEFIDFSNNFLDDKTGYMISRLISRQTERRDQTIWKYGLRNERPDSNEYTKGLVLINLSDNYISDTSADSISIALQNDTYLRSLDLSKNQIFLDGCKKLVRSMRRNTTLLNLDLRENYGYNENIHKRILIKISRNVKMQFKNFDSDGIGYSKENDYLKNFINYEFFNFEIPQEIIEKYNLIVGNENNSNGYNANNAFSFGNGIFNNYTNNYSDNNNMYRQNNKYIGDNENNFCEQNPNNDDSDNVINSHNTEEHIQHKNENLNIQGNKSRKYSINKESENNSNKCQPNKITSKIKNNNNSNSLSKKNNKISNHKKNNEENLNMNINKNINKDQHQNNIPIGNLKIAGRRINNSLNNNLNIMKKKKNSFNNLLDQKQNKKAFSSNNPKNFLSEDKVNHSDNNINIIQRKKNSNSKTNLEERRFEYKVEKTQKNENKSKSEDIQFELEADNEYDKIINEENDDDDFIFRNYSDGEIFCKNDITNDNNYSLPLNNQTNLDTFLARDNKHSLDNKNAYKFFEKFKFCRCSKNFKKVYYYINRKNRLLFIENLKLRKQLLTVRAINLSMNQQRLNNNNMSNTITNNFEDINLNNGVTGNLSLTNNINNISSKAPPMTGEDGSYEMKYNRIENLLGELTRLMDNMENTMNAQNNNNQNPGQNLSLSRGNTSTNNRRDRGNYRRINERKQETILEEN